MINKSYLNLQQIYNFSDNQLLSIKIEGIHISFWLSVKAFNGKHDFLTYML